MKPINFSHDICEFLFLLNSNKVKYVIIGGEAVIHYGHPRLTGDIDFFYGLDEDNTRALHQTLLEFWDNSIPGNISASDLRTPDYVIQFGVPPNRIDLLNTIDGLSFDEVWEQKKLEKIKLNQKEIPVYFISVKHLIHSKEKADRGKDRDDLRYLRKLLEDK